MAENLDQLLKELQCIVAKINREMLHEQIFVTEYPLIDGAIPGLAMWFPTHCIPLTGPEYSVINRENIIIHPAPSMPEFHELLKTECKVVQEAGHAASNLLISTFDQGQPDGSIKRTTFNMSQWPSEDAARKWLCQSASHREILEQIKHQPHVSFEPSTIASYQKVKEYIPFQCSQCKQMSMHTQPQFTGKCEKCKLVLPK